MMFKINFLAIISISFLLLLPLTLANGSDLWPSLNVCSNVSTTEFTPGQVVYINGDYLSQGFHKVKITGTKNSCHQNQIIWGEFDLHKGDSGTLCMVYGKVSKDLCGEYVFTIDGKNTTFIVNNQDYPIVPEFGFIAGLTLIIITILAFFFIRRK